MRSRRLCGFLVLSIGSAVAAAPLPEFRSAWPANVERTWVGPACWANRLQDWRTAAGRLECTTSGGNRTVGLLTRQIGPQAGDVRMSVRLGRLTEGKGFEGWAGFRIGAKGRLASEPTLRDWRDDVVRGAGLDLGVTADGKLFIGRDAPRVVLHRGIDRSTWTVKHADSVQGKAQAPELAFDGDPATYWHTKFGAPPYPHELQIDLGKETDIAGFVYLPRQDQVIGRIKDYEFYTSLDGERWGEPAAKGAFANTDSLQEVTCAPRRGRFIRLRLLSDFAGRPAAVIAELFVLDEAPAGGGTRPSDPRRAPAAPSAAVPLDDIELRMTAVPAGDAYAISLSAHIPATGTEIARVRREGVDPAALAGGIALVCDHESPTPSVREDGRATAPGRGGAEQAGGNLRFWFKDWRVGGSKLAGGDAQAFGPILWTQYTLSRNVLKLSAQFPPIGAEDTQEAHLEIREGGAWKRIASARIDALARTAAFRVADWASTRDIPYRVVYALVVPDGSTRDVHWEGMVRRDPVEKEVIAVAGFTGNADYAWPNVDLVAHLEKLDPDVLFFSGDNIYENVGGYGIERSPLDRACLDYLRKWYFYGWSFRNLLRDRPCVSIPDDHDVYHPNLWGQGGRKTDKDDEGGYLMDAEWVKMVERTQTSHLPDPYDPAPIEQGIGVYYSPMTYGRISFAVVEDRKFKTGPSGVVPPTTTGRADHENRPDFDSKRADVAGAKLLGDRQLAFLRDWAADWRGADFKVVLSQTIFCGAATHHGAGLTRLRIDYDSNGWPQTGRNKALREMRRGFAFHMAGDQHLATLIHQGVEDWDDAAWSLCVPSVTNFYLRAWRPEPEMRHGPLADGMPDYTGRFLDGLGNRISVWAATNPGEVGVAPAWLHDHKPGFGLIRLDKRADTIAIECWPRYADPTGPEARQFEGWPKTIAKLDNYGRKAVAYLPVISVKGMENPVIQIIDEEDGEIVYTVRIRGTRIRPKVFREGTYTVRVGEQPDGMKTFRGVKAPAAVEILEARF
ncbi:MAG: discoidin domain-containing protein [Planctomycetes bacterium]|nr:discoidin domain-containing protein [Planctomycetota bacterium]